MNFLDLCKAARQEMGISGTGPTAVLNQTGEMKRVVDWVARAYREICAKHANWEFLRSSFSVNTVAGTEAYAPTDCTDSVIGQAIGHATVGKFGNWIPYDVDGVTTFRIYKQSEGAGTRQYFWPIPYASFRNLYQLIVPSNNRPTYWTVRPRDKAILVGPKADAVYVVEGEYWRVAPGLADDADVPLIPERFHEVILWRAVRYYALYEEDGGVYAGADKEYRNLMGQLRRDQLPKLALAEPLA